MKILQIPEIEMFILWRLNAARLIVLGGLLLSAERVGAQPHETPVEFPGTSQFDLQAPSGETYRIFLRKPLESIPEAGSPVVYTTDGNINFLSLLAALDRQPALRGAVVVAIGYPEEDRREYARRRTHDLLTPVNPDWVESLPPERRGHFATVAGGADPFLDFIEEYVKPEVERRCRIDPQRQLLFGHSFGGLLVLHAMLQHPERFQIYCASSPSLWVNDRSLLQQLDAQLARLAPGQRRLRLLITVGEEEAAGFTTDPAREAMLSDYRQVEHARELNEQIQRAAPEIDVSFEIFPHEDHGSAILPAASRALRGLSR